MDPRPVKSAHHVEVVFDRGPHRKAGKVPCLVVQDRFDDRSRRLATVVNPHTGKPLEVVFSPISGLWRPVRS